MAVFVWLLHCPKLDVVALISGMADCEFSFREAFHMFLLTTLSITISTPSFLDDHYKPKKPLPRQQPQALLMLASSHDQLHQPSPHGSVHEMTGGRQHNVSSFLELATARPVAPKASARAFTAFVDVFCPFVPACLFQARNRKTYLRGHCLQTERNLLVLRAMMIWTRASDCQWTGCLSELCASSEKTVF